MLKNKTDRRAITVLLLNTALVPVQWYFGFHWGLWLFAMWMAVPVAVIAHNHNHMRTFESPRMNQFMDYWITLLYGFPAFAWIPTHNQNHHRYTNREGDYTQTYRYSEGNNLFMLITYPQMSGSFQQIAIVKFMKNAYKRAPKNFWKYMGQLAALVIYYAVVLVIDWKKALLFVVAPTQFALYMVMIFNFLQHVHADEESDINHSRNFVGKALNWHLFNNGLHTVHHENPSLHWSEYPKAHAAIVDKIDPSLNEPSFFWYLLRVYILGPVVPSMRSKSMRLARIERERAQQNDGTDGALPGAA